MKKILLLSTAMFFLSIAIFAQTNQTPAAQTTPATKIEPAKKADCSKKNDKDCKKDKDCKEACHNKKEACHDKKDAKKKDAPKEAAKDAKKPS